MATSSFDLPTTPVLAAASKVQTPDPDRAIRIQHNHDYPERVWYAIACLITLISLFHWFGVLVTRLRRNSAKKPLKRGVVSYRRLPHAVINTFRAIAFRSTISIGSYSVNLTEVALTAGYIGTVFGITLMNSTSTKGVKFDPKYWANLAGIVAGTQFPLLAALGSRNNIIAFLTGISYEKLNYLHRMVARVVCVLIWLHGAGRFKLGLTGSFTPDHPWVQCGPLAASAFTILIILSIRPVRQRHFEVFIITHTILALLTLLTAYFHAQGIGIGADKYIWPALVVWGFDRFLRLLKLVIFNAHYYLNSRSSISDSHASIEALSPRFLRVTVKAADYFRWQPGQSIYLNIPAVSKWRCEFHPFTISSISSALTSTSTSSDVSAISTEDIDTKSVSTEANGPSPSKTVSRKLTFYIRVHNGFTARLRDAAQIHTKLRVVLDGPYSAPPRLDGYGSIVLIAGGTGVAFTLPLFLETINRAKENPQSACQRLVFVWANPESKSLEWISSELRSALRDCPKGLEVSIDVYITGGNKDPYGLAEQASLGSNEKGEATVTQETPSTSVHNLSIARVQEGRPDVRKILTEELERANDSMSVNVCGPTSMSNTAKAVLRSPRFADILKGGPNVNLHIEGFGV